MEELAIVYLKINYCCNEFDPWSSTYTRTLVIQF